jgi:predicted lipoprotein with Yx(FWY)xxD motif
MDGTVVTYNRWPLYTYVGDSKPGQASGQALDLNGGLWYVLSPSGKVITKKP